MSYDINLNTFPPEPLSSERLEAARAILARYGARSEGPRFHCHSVRWDDGAGFALYCKALFDDSTPFGALLTPLGGLSPRFCDFTYEFAAEVGCAIWPDVIPPFVLVTDPAILTEATRSTFNVIQISDGLSVHRALAESYQGWRTLLYDTVTQLNDALRADSGSG